MNNEAMNNEPMNNEAWMPLRKFQADGLPLYPDGLLELLTGGGATR